MLLRHYLEQGMSKAALARYLGISRRTVYNWIEAGELGQDADKQGGQVGAETAATIEARPLQGNHRRSPGGVPEAERRATVRRSAGGGLSGWLRADEALRAPGSTEGAGGAGPKFRDASGPLGEAGRPPERSSAQRKSEV